MSYLRKGDDDIQDYRIIRVLKCTKNSVRKVSSPLPVWKKDGKFTSLARKERQNLPAVFIYLIFIKIPTYVFNWKKRLS